MAEVRRGTPADTDTLVAMGRALHQESPRYREMQFDEAKVRRLAQHLHGTLLAPVDEAAILVVDVRGEIVGMAVGVLAERWFGPDRYATDLTVYVKPEHRGSRAFVRLMRAFEDWAAGQGVRDVAIGVSTEIGADATVCAYQRLGYTLSGYTLTKTLRHGN